MIDNTQFKTSLQTRIIIGLIALIMVISTAALYFGMIVQYNVDSSTMSDIEKAEYELLMNEYQNKLTQQDTELSTKYFSTFSKYKSEVKAYNSASITELSTRDLLIGDGRELAEDDISYSAYYIGWLSDETIFDSSFDSNDIPTKLSAPLQGSNELIEGWLRGIVGMKLGGIREITIPADLAYGADATGVIPANSPLKFIIMVIESPEDPPVSDRLWELYQKQSNETGGASY